MNIDELRTYQAKFEDRIDSLNDKYKHLHKVREQFVKYFSTSRIKSMSLKEYAVGFGEPDRNFNFCNGLERQLDGLGRITGATAFKFGVYYGRTSSDSKMKFRHAAKYGNTYNSAFEKVKTEILALLEDGNNGNIADISRNILSPMFKGKILSTYFPSKFLNIFSEEHVNHYLMALNLDYKGVLREDVINKRQLLLQYKNDDEIMRLWSNDVYCEFLYSEFPIGENNQDTAKKGNDILKKYRNPKFPLEQEGMFVDFKIGDLNTTSKNTDTNKVKGKYDYESDNQRKAAIGDRGEKIVFDLEVKRLKDQGLERLARKVKRLSLESDSYGFDILSYENNGEERLIEVKATMSRVGLANFYLTKNELKVAKENSNFYIYIVFDLSNQTPKVWPIKNPFNPMNSSIEIEPIAYQVKIQNEKGS